MREYGLRGLRYSTSLVAILGLVILGAGCGSDTKEPHGGSSKDEAPHAYSVDEVRAAFASAGFIFGSGGATKGMSFLEERVKGSRYPPESLVILVFHTPAAASAALPSTREGARVTGSPVKRFANLIISTRGSTPGAHAPIGSFPDGVDAALVILSGVRRA